MQLQSVKSGERCLGQCIGSTYCSWFCHYGSYPSLYGNTSLEADNVGKPKKEAPIEAPVSETPVSKSMED
ncbi:hypothetical protein VNO77_27039 [Canavalia gladiata]|uniref:Uncharacterized protein n=1 Tax=Canavalia gladiata TaxID=3824 RepID=A0AAN9KTY5_CANGL